MEVERIKKVLKNIIKVTLSNIFILLSGILTGFIIPKIMGISDYGYYKTFTLYISYSSIFRFGIVDGIYLIFGGKDYKELNKEKFRFYSKFMCILEVIISVIFITVAITFLDGEYRYIFLFVAIYIWSFNITSYYQIISQITGRFNELSTRNILQAILSSIGVLLFWLLYKIVKYELTYKIYTTFYVIIQILLSMWYIFTYREITFGKSSKVIDEYREILNLMKVGFPLLISNLCSTLLLNLDRQFVNILFDNLKYAIYAFAYNLLSLVTVATSAISTVIYPILKRVKNNELQKMYPILVTVMLVFVFAALLIYFPLSIFIKLFLPKYIESLEIFKIIFPGLAITSVITVIMHNYYKVLGKNKKYFVKSVIILLISFVSNYIAYICFNTISSISIASMIVMLYWYLTIESYFVKEYNVKWIKNYIYMILMIVVFYVIVFVIKDIIIGFLAYMLLFFFISLLFFKNDFDQIYNLIKGRKE